MRLTAVVSTLYGGGGERIALDLAEGWVARGHQVTLLTLSTQESDAYPVPGGVERWALGGMGSAGGPLAGPLRMARRAMRIRRAIRMASPDVVVSFMVPTTVLTLFATRGLGIPVFVYELTDPAMEPVTRPNGWLRRLLYPGAAAVLAQTPRAKDVLVRLAPGSRVEVAPGFVPPFVQSPGFGRPPDGPPCFVAIGRLSRQKGFDLLLEAFARVKDALPEWTLRIIGSGVLHEPLEAQRLALGLGTRAELIPRNPAPWTHATTASIFVLSSRYEGFPNVLLEAMASGLPPIAFDCPSGPREIIRPGDTGILVPCGDVGALADAMLRLARAPVERAAIAARATSVRLEWGLDRALDAWDDLFARATHRSREAVR